jgi:hypothetical protein
MRRTKACDGWLRQCSGAGGPKWVPDFPTHRRTIIWGPTNSFYLHSHSLDIDYMYVIMCLSLEVYLDQPSSHISFFAEPQSLLNTQKPPQPPP